MIEHTPNVTTNINLADLELLGPIVRLQVQTAPLKQGAKPGRWYDPTPITSVPSLRIEAGGVVGLDGDRTLGDVHHRDHPLSRFRGENGVSVGFTSHYTRIRDQFGDHLGDGIAGESILIASGMLHDLASLANGMVVVTSEGVVPLGDVQIAAPCVEFSKFCLGYEREQAADLAVSRAVAFLHHGVRGFYATCDQDGGPIAALPPIGIGDLVYRRLPA